MSLQDELTPEFLSWLLGEEVTKVIRDKYTLDNEIEYSYIDLDGIDGRGNYLNLDTLTRLIKEKCSENSWIIKTWIGVNCCFCTSYNIEDSIDTRLDMNANTELEAVIKSGKYVMEKVK